LPAVLEQSQVAHYLVALGLVNPRTILEEQVTVVDASSRNSVFVATVPDATLVVKQAAYGKDESLAHEATVLRELAPLRLGPEVVHAAAGRIVLRTPPSVPWGRQGRAPRLTAAALGRALGTLHRVQLELVAPEGFDRMWGLPEPPLDEVRDFSDGALELLMLLQSSSALCDRLRRLGAEAGEAAFAHGEPRWANCLAVAAPGSRRHTRALLIDWERAGRGDAAADLGTVLGEYLGVWAANPLGARWPSLERLKPAMRAFWDGYRRSGAPAAERERVAGWAAVRLLHLALQRAHAAQTATGRPRLLLQLADNILATPGDAAGSLMGMPA